VGQTAKVGDRIAAFLDVSGVLVVVFDANVAPAPSGYEGVILGDSIHLMEHSQSLTRYASRYADELHASPLALFQVSLTSANDDDEHSTRAHQLVSDFVHETGIDPDLVGMFAGSLVYSKYGWAKRRLMRKIAFTEVGATDMSADHEYTDWEAVDHFATDAAALILRAASEVSAAS
jgi:menaquinone-dependent protoporphyrinogen oxidase